MSGLVGIVGFGRFGRFWAETLRPDFELLVYDRDPGRNSSPFLQTDLPTLCAKVETIFLAVPINQFEPTLTSLRGLLRPGQLIFDLCSVKLYPAGLMQQQLSQLQLELIASHPMFGPDSAAGGLAGLPFVMWPLGPKSERYQRWHTYFSQRGLRVIEMSPDEHDRLTANSQGVTHYIGRVLDQMTIAPTPIDTKGFQVLRGVVTQTCNDSWELFHDLQHYNPYTQAMRLQLESALWVVYEKLLPQRVDEQEWVIGIQGGQGSFNEEACRHYVAAHPAGPFRILYLYQSLNVLRALHEGRIDRGVFALQNGRGGMVLETIQALSRYNCDLLDIFEMVIDHCLLFRPDTPFSQITTLISHPQALAQCAATLRRHYPHLQQTSGQGDLIDQALCAKQLAEGRLPPTTAVLASRVCADLYGLQIEAASLQDLGPANLTTFAWAKRKGYE